MTENTIQAIWNKGKKANDLDEDMFRLDACGAMIMRDKYGMNNKYGWVIDHIIPLNMGGDDSFINLRPIHYLNEKSKANDYPSYTAIIKFDGTDNIELKQNLSVNKKLRELLKKHYKINL